MSLVAAATSFVERCPIFVPGRRPGIDGLVGRTRQQLAGRAVDVREFARDMETRQIAEHPERANKQHYALPPAFLQAFLARV